MNPDAQGWFVFTTGFLVVLNVAAMVVSIIAQTRRRPPLDKELQGYAKVQAISDLRQEFQTQLSGVATRADEHADEVRHSMDKLRDEIRSDYQRIQQSGEARAGKIHDRINEVLEEVSELRGRVRKGESL